MGFLNTLRNLKRWFTNKTGITEPRIESTKRKHDECETIKNKRARMDDSLVEVVEISDESLSEAEEVEITEPGPSTLPLRASPPVMFIGKQRKNLMSPVRTIDLTESSDEETKKNTITQLYNVSSNQSNRITGIVRSASGKFNLEEKYSPTSSIKGSRNLSSNVEGSFSALQISNSTPMINSKEKVLAMILKNYVSPKSSDEAESSTSTRSSLSIHKENSLNQSKISQTSDKENVDIPEISFCANKIINQEMFYDRLIRKFKEQSAITRVFTTVKQIAPEDIFKEKLEAVKKELEKIEPPKKKDVFPGYCKDIVDNISLQMCGINNEYIIKGKNLRRSDLKTAYLPTAWLNDEVINHYLNLIIDRDPMFLHTFDTFFYYKLSSQGYQSVRRWSRKKDIFACKKMFCPIHMGNHWCLICVNFIDKTVTYYDSLKGKNFKCLDTIFYYLKEEYKNKKNEDFDCSGWRLMHADDCPQQRNGFDCGVFTCINAEYLARDAVLDFTQDDMPILRHRLCYEILNNKLCY